MSTIKSILKLISFLWLLFNCPDWMVVMWVVYWVVALWFLLEQEYAKERA